MNGIQKVVGSIPIVSTKLSLDAIRVPGSFFIEMSDSRFNQSKWTHFAGRVPHKSLPFIGEAFPCTLAPLTKGSCRPQSAEGLTHHYPSAVTSSHHLPFIGEASSYTDKKEPLPNDRGSDDYLWY